MDGDFNEQDSLNNGESSTDENATDDNVPTEMSNITFYETCDYEISVENTTFDNSHLPVSDNVPHDQDALNNAARLERSFSGSSNSSHVSELPDCDTCKLLRGIFSSRETVDLWDKVVRGGNQNKCHSKFWIKFIEKLKEEFPHEDGLKSKQTMFLFKTLLGVSNRDDAEVDLADLLTVVRFFGPIKPDSDGRYLLIQHV
ncbi:uncharacterized protein LOC134277633 [Saccostrea cucullata]|uniref:uncharacterized protein LOC134277633 n=1 Tax=Saccostrea cuccullata TaxID=36930 RepID=UPI002ED30F31